MSTENMYMGDHMSCTKRLGCQYKLQGLVLHSSKRQLEMLRVPDLEPSNGWPSKMNRPSMTMVLPQ